MIVRAIMLVFFIMLDVGFWQFFCFCVYIPTFPMEEFIHRHHEALASLWGTHIESANCSSMHTLRVDFLLITC